MIIFENKYDVNFIITPETFVKIMKLFLRYKYIVNK